MPITHKRVATFADQPGVEINKAEWNDSHTGTLDIPMRPQVVATNCAVNNSLRQGTAGARSDVRLEGRRIHYVGQSAISQLQVGMVGYYLKNDATGENLIGNDFVWESAIELTSPAMYQENFVNNGNSKYTNIIAATDGTPLVLTDAVGIDVPAGGSFYVRQAVTVATASLFIPSTSQTAPATDTGFISPAIVSQVPATGAMTSPSGGTSFSGTQAALILGIPKTAMPAVCVIGDSIADGTGDTVDSFGNLGFVTRGLQSVNGFPIPWGKQTVGSDRFSKNTLDTSPRKRALWKYFTHAIVELGTNDIAALTTFSAMQLFVTNIATSLKNTVGPYGQPLKVAFTTMMPRTTSTDSWATAANQTPVAGFTVGGVRDQYNTFLASQVGILFDALIDVNPYVEDQANKGKWITNGSANYPTIDGIHPNSALHILAANAVSNWAATIAP